MDLLKHLADGKEALASDLVVIGLAQVADGVGGLFGEAKVFEELGKGIGFGKVAGDGFVREAVFGHSS